VNSPRPRPTLRIGTAGWAIPRAVADSFPTEGSGLGRYAGRFDAAEINSSFHRAHRPATYERWAASTPAGFRFSAKIPKTITHQRRLVGAEDDLARFLDEVSALGAKIGPLIVQLPPTLVCDEPVVAGFFAAFRTRWTGAIACEPRHPSWFAEPAEALLRAHEVARVGADPARVPEAAEPGGWEGYRYTRLHGSPRMYYSPYEPDQITRLAARLASASVETWCMFDNTASGAAAANALELVAALDISS
jgi:uncharacterized protein YecE (DUF72 family)